MEDLSPFLPQGIDYLGFLDAKLRDLRGYTTLAHEFLQNADDAAATEVIFDFRADALFVQNNKVFTDCDQVGEPECPWKRDPTRGHRCDFHRFRLVAGRDKRDDSDTIGAFGIGFISAYQITDRPELSSGKRRWIIRPEEPERSRIEQERNSTIADTVFRLPWAFQQNGALRKALSLEPVTLAGIEQFKVELARSLPLAILFLRNVRRVELRVEGHLSMRIDRSSAEDRLVVHDGQHDHAWQVFTGNFQIEASDIRKHSGGRIEAKRKSEVTIAIPGPAVDSAGLLYAYLPTEHRTGLPLNINGDFFPSSDRKRVLLDTGDYQQVWNEAAIKAAARVFAENCLAIRDFLGEKGFWKALQELEQVAQDAEGIQQNTALGAFWEVLKDKLPHLEVVKTSGGAWKRPVEVCLLRSKEEEEALPVLECIGLHVVHPDLRFAQNLLTKSEVGVPILKLSDLALALQRCGLTERALLKSAPNWIQSATNREQLGGEIETLREQRVAIAEREAALQKIRGCSIAVAENGDLAPPSALRRASRNTLEVFESFGASLYFLALENPHGIAELVSEFTLEDAVRFIEGISSEALLKSWRHGAERFKCLIGWFADHRASIRGNQTMQTRLRNLAIWPSGKSLYPLTDLTVPGNFEDALHLARIVDLEFLGEYRDFFIELGAHELTFSTYALMQVPNALSVDADISRDVRRSVLQLLATRMGEFTYLPESREKLAACPIAECMDGIFRAPAHVYFDAPSVKKLLGSDVSVVLLSPERETAVREFLKWLGVAERPRPKDIVEKIRSLVQGTAETDKRVSIQRIFSYLGRLWGREEDRDEFAFRELKTLAWLPIHGDLKTWYVPAKIYAIYSSHLFETQACFLDVPRQEQGQASEFIRFLEMGVEPSPVQVVNHLLARAKEKSDVNRDVYRFLTQKAEDSAILRLRGTACLLLDGVGYAHPDQVFWGPHPFGRFRFQLPSDHGVYKPLFERLGVHETPDAEDSIKVLSGISDEFGSSNQPLDDGTFQVVMQCWKLIEDFLNTGRLDARKLQVLNTRKVVADDRKLLQRPDHMFFDDRAGLASRFKDLIQHNVIVRPLGAWHAMEAAGVQPLSRAVKTSLVECDGPVEATDIVARLTDRHTLIARVIEAHRTDTAGWKLEVFERLTVERAPRLGVTHTLKAFGQVRTTPYEEVPVYYDANNEALYLRNDSPPPWAAIARELAFAVNPDLEPGAIAPGFKEVLNANSVEEATQILDDLGYPSLEVHLAQQLTSAPIGLGGSAPPPLGLDEATQLGSSSSSFQASVTTTQDALRALGISTNPEPLPPGLDKQEPVSSGTARSSRKSRGSQLRTYVAPEGEATASDMDEDEKRRRSSLAKAGVKRVMDYEQSGGRNPIEMPVNYPGYDIEARNQDGAVVRFIEVKSVPEDWNRRGVGLSREQFDQASELGDKYWLYVVENAEGDEFYIYRIQDPARKTNQFFYDDGWIGLAEEEEAGPLADPMFS